MTALKRACCYAARGRGGDNTSAAGLHPDLSITAFSSSKWSDFAWLQQFWVALGQVVRTGDTVCRAGKGSACLGVDEGLAADWQARHQQELHRFRRMGERLAARHLLVCACACGQSFPFLLGRGGVGIAQVVAPWQLGSLARYRR